MDTLIQSKNVHTTISVDKLNHECKLSKQSQTDFCNCQLLIHLIWPVFILILVALFYEKIVKLIDVLIDRFKTSLLDFFGIKVGYVNSNELDKISKKINVDIDNVIILKNENVKNILSTFYKHQTERDDSMNTIIWTFTLTNNKEFINNVTFLISIGLVLEASNKQYCLTKEGYNFCFKNKELIGTFSYFN
jgi:hypothetical protein